MVALTFLVIVCVDSWTWRRSRACENEAHAAGGCKDAAADALRVAASVGEGDGIGWMCGWLVGELGRRVQAGPRRRTGGQGSKFTYRKHAMKWLKFKE